MSRENVEIVRRIVDAWNRRDEDEMVALTDPEAEYVNFPTAVEPGTRRGINELLAVARMQWDFLRDSRVEIDRIYDRGEEIIVLGRLSFIVLRGDTRIEERVLASWTIRGGKVVRNEVLGFRKAEVEKALEAAGLSE